MPEFVNRVTHIPFVESGLKTATEKYESMKTFVPKPLTYAVGMAEGAVSLALSTAENVAARFPQPVEYADSMACSALDKVETQTKKLNELMGTLPLHLLSPDHLTNLTITDEQKSYYLELFQYAQNCRAILTEKVAFEIEFVQRRMQEATQELYKRLQEFLKEIEKESPQGEVAKLPKPIIRVIKHTIRIMNDLLARLSALKEKSQGEAERVYNSVHKILADVKDKTAEFAHDGTVKVQELRQYIERVKLVKDVLSFIQKYTPLGRLLPTISANNSEEMIEMASENVQTKEVRNESVKNNNALSGERENGKIDEREEDYEEVGNDSFDNSEGHEEAMDGLEDSHVTGDASLLEHSETSESSDEEEERQF